MPLYSLSGREPGGLVIVGTGQTADVLQHYIFEEYGEGFPVVNTVTDNFLGQSQPSNARTVIPISDCYSEFPSFGWMIAISYQNRSTSRGKVLDQVAARSVEICSYWHPNSHVWTEDVLRPNQLFLENVVVQFGSSVGANTFLWSGSHVGHHTKIGNDSFIASGAVVSGSVTIGDNAFLGVNSFVADGVSAGRFLFVGAGAGLVADCGDFGLAVPGKAL